MNLPSLGTTLKSHYTEAMRLGKALNDLPGVDTYPDDPTQVKAQFAEAESMYGNRTVQVSVDENFVEYSKNYTSIRPQQVAEGSVHQRTEITSFDVSHGLEQAPFEYFNGSRRESLDPNNPRQDVDLTIGTAPGQVVRGTINLLTGTITAIEGQSPSQEGQAP